MKATNTKNLMDMDFARKYFLAVILFSVVGLSILFAITHTHTHTHHYLV